MRPGVDHPVKGAAFAPRRQPLEKNGRDRLVIPLGDGAVEIGAKQPQAGREQRGFFVRLAHDFPTGGNGPAAGRPRRSPQREQGRDQVGREHGGNAQREPENQADDGQQPAAIKNNRAMKRPSGIV